LSSVPENQKIVKNLPS